MQLCTVDCKATVHKYYSNNNNNYIEKQRKNGPDIGFVRSFAHEILKEKKQIQWQRIKNSFPQLINLFFYFHALTKLKQINKLD